MPQDVKRNCDRVLTAVKCLLSRCNACFPSDNLTAEERTELERLRRDPDICISPADKGGKWVVMPRSDYDAEAFSQLNNADFYRPLDFPLQSFVKRRLLNFLNLLYKKRFLTRREFRALTPPEDPCDREFYLIPKIHKSVWPSDCMPPGRPIVSDVQSISRRSASLIEYFLAPLARLADSYVRDSLHVTAILQALTFDCPVILFTFDITSLYTNIPTEDGIAAVSRAFLGHKDTRRPDLTVISMLRLLLTTNDFSFRGEHFLQTQGTAMGCAFGASYANIYLTEWDQAIQRHSHPPALWLRYIDDVFGIWTHGEELLLEFRDFVNSIYPTINVTLSFNTKCINFLDLELYLSAGKILHRIAFKPTDSFNILPPTSFHPSHTFRSIVHSQVYRWCTRSSSYADFKRTKSIVQQHWKNQGYSRSTVRAAVKHVFRFTGFSPSRWQRGFLSCDVCSVCKYSFFTDVVHSSTTIYPILHFLTCTTSGVLYLIVCSSCDMKYVGETSRTLQQRIAEHVYNITRNASTSVARHFNSACSLADFSFTALEHQANPHKRARKEISWIGRLRTASPNGLNRVTRCQETLPLVLPHSSCSQRIVRLCQTAMRDVTAVGAYRTPRNLRRAFGDNRSRPPS